MKYVLTLLIGALGGAFLLMHVQNFDLTAWITNKVVSVQEQGSGILALAYLKVSPVKKLTTLEVNTIQVLHDDYFKDYKLFDVDTPETLDRIISQIIIEGKVTINAVYGYTEEQIGTFANPEKRGEPQLLYYEIKENNIEKVLAGIGISSDALVKRVVNVVLQGIHDKLRTEFASNPEYLKQAKENALCKFGGKCVSGF